LCETGGGNCSLHDSGAMVEHTIKMAQHSGEWVSYEEVVASRGKVQRAEPVAALYEPEKLKVSHVPKDGEDLTHLEDQMRQMATDGFMGEGSPDRVDALVWALSSLMITGSTYDHTMAWVG
jgi:phage terminase large subunit-like protein